MPAFTTPDGRTVYVPGVYLDTDVRDALPRPLPEFHVPIVVADVHEGYPHDHDDQKEDEEPSRGAFTLVTSPVQAQRLFGTRSEAAIALQFAFRHGLPLAYVSTAAPLTRASVIATSGAGAAQEIEILGQRWGFPAGWIKLAHDGSDGLTVLPPRYYSKVTADAGAGSTRILVDDTSWITEGMGIEIGDNAVAQETATVSRVGSYRDSNGQLVRYVDLTAGTAGAFTIAQDAAIAFYAPLVDSKASGLIDGDALIDWINNTPGLGLFAKRGSGFTGAALDTVASLTPLREIASWGSATAGTSPSASTANHTTMIGNIEATWWDDFLMRYQIIPRMWAIVTGDSTNHASWASFADARRVEGVPVGVMVGTRWGDTVIGAGDDTDPVFRASTLNNQNVALVAGGLDLEPAYRSHMPAVFGRRIQGGVAHNLTQDELIYSEVEYAWDERGSQELTALHKAGVITYRLRASAPFRYVISQGLNTLQANLNTWNSDGTSALIHQRDLADAVNAALLDELDGTQLGVEVDRSTLSARVIRRGQQLLRRGWLTGDLTIVSLSLDDSGNGWVGEWGAPLPPPTDFIGGTTYVVLGT